MPPDTSRYSKVVIRTAVTAPSLVALWFSWRWARGTVTELAYHWPSLAAGARGGYVGLALLWLGLTAGAALLALVLVWLSGERAEARALAICLSLLAYTPAADSLAGPIARSGFGAGGAHFANITRDFGILFAGVALVRFTALFPRPLTVGELPYGRTRSMRIALLDGRRLWRLGAILAAAFALFINLADVMAGDAVARALLPLQVILGLLLLAMAVRNLGTPRPDLRDDQRRQRDWILQGFVAATAVLLLASALKLVQMLTGYTAPFAKWYIFALALGLDLIIFFLAVAMFYQGAIEPRLAIRRTAVLGLVGTALVFAFVGVEQLVEETMRESIGLNDRWGGILTGGIIALSFEPLKHRSTRFVERILGSHTGEGLHSLPSESSDAPAPRRAADG